MNLNNIITFLLLFSLLSSCSTSSSKMDLKVDRFVLPNGLTALLVKREGAPVFSSYIRIKVGNIEEPTGSSGLAHFFEHMAFKGTPSIGGTDYESEKEVLKNIFETGEELDRLKRNQASSSEIEKLSNELKKYQSQEQQLIKKNEFVQIYQRNGGSDINATTSNDYTSYFVSLPSSKLELWAYLESERLRHPVFREFYKERDVVAEERRMRYDNSPDGKLYETFMNQSFDNSPYGINVIGTADDIQNYTYEVASQFHSKYYIPSRMVLALVGNFNIDQAKKILLDTFGKLPKKENPSDQTYKESLKNYPRSKSIHWKTSPRFYLGFHRPAHPHPDDEVFDVIHEALCVGRTSRMYQKLVLEEKVASQVGCYSSLPGSRLDGVFSFYAIPLKGFTNKMVESKMIEVIDSLKKELVSPEELKKIQNRIQADLIYSLESNMNLALLLTYFESLSGDWQYIYQMQDRIEKITPQDVKRVVSQYFVPERKIFVSLEPVGGDQ